MHIYVLEDQLICLKEANIQWCALWNTLTLATNTMSSCNNATTITHVHVYIGATCMYTVTVTISLIRPGWVGKSLSISEFDSTGGIMYMYTFLNGALIGLTYAHDCLVTCVYVTDRFATAGTI